MAPKRKRGPKPAYKRQPSRAQLDQQEIEALDKLLKDGAPPPGSNPLKMKAEPPCYGGVYKFEELPLSLHTKKGLKTNKFTQLTAIQRAALPHALCGRDILGAAKTGSGKTLAFIIPVLETLYRARWTQLDGLGALLLSPTRELAMQIFEELRKVGTFHDLSAGLLIGGKNVKEEKSMVGSMNILVCTPGRLLQHLDETPGFDCSNVQVLVLDEADRCMDMGFSGCMDAIIENLPKQRHTMLFSATQSKKVSDLARLSLVDPEYVAVHADAPNATPHKLKQAYIACELHQKMDLLWFFMKTHQKQKTIVFLSTCRQVTFVYEAFKKMRPGVPLKMLHGHMKQPKRMAVFEDFNAATSMVLLATDIAARGLDFPHVDWVVQADCPEDVASYIHRVGRTARFKSAGEGLLFLLPSEEAMLTALQEAKVPLQKRGFDAKKLTPVTPALTALLAKSDDLKVAAQAAFVSYFKSVYLNPNKAVFDILKLDAAEFAASFGLPTAPRLRFAEKHAKAVKRKAEKGVAGEVSAGADDNDDDAAPANVGEVSGGESDSEGYAENERGAARAGSSEPDDEDDDFLVLKAATPGDGDAEADSDADLGRSRVPDAAMLAAMHKKRKRKKLKIKADSAPTGKIVFDDDGEALDPMAALVHAFEEDGASEPSDAAERFARQKALMRERDLNDKAADKERRQEAKLLKKAKARAARVAEQADMGVELGGANNNSDDGGMSGSEDGRGGAHSDGVRFGANSSDDNEDESPRALKRQQGVGAAYKGMRAVDDDDAAPAGGTAGAKRRRAAVETLDVSAQEKLALKLLGLS